MRKLLAFMTALTFFAVTAGVSFAGIQVSAGGTRWDENQIRTAVFNNSGSALTSGSVVVWDTTATAGTTLGAYVTTTTTVDSSLTAGVIVSDSIASGAVGTMVIRGPIQVRFAEVTDGATEAAGDRVGTTSIAGQCGVGSRLGVRLSGAVGGAADNELIWVFVDPDNGT